MARPGFLYFSATDEPWPDDDQDALGKLPEDWLEQDNGGAGQERAQALGLAAAAARGCLTAVRCEGGIESTSCRRRSASACIAAWRTMPAQRIGLRQAGRRWLRGAQHGDDDSQPDGLCAACCADRRWNAERPQAAELHRQPAGRIAAGGPFQRLRGDWPAARRRSIARSQRAGAKGFEHDA